MTSYARASHLGTKSLHRECQILVQQRHSFFIRARIFFLTDRSIFVAFDFGLTLLTELSPVVKEGSVVIMMELLQF